MNGDSGGTTTKTYQEHLSSLSKEDLVRMQTTNAAYSRQWQEKYRIYLEAFKKMRALFETAINMADSQAQQTQLSNLQGPVQKLINRGAALLQEDPAYYPENINSVMALGAAVDQQVKWQNRTSAAYQNKKSDDFSYGYEIAEYGLWGIQGTGWEPLYKDTTHEMETFWIDTKENLKVAADEAGDIAKKYAWPIGLGVGAVVIFIIWSR